VPGGMGHAAVRFRTAVALGLVLAYTWIPPTPSAGLPPSRLEIEVPDDATVLATVDGEVVGGEDLRLLAGMRHWQDQWGDLDSRLMLLDVAIGYTLLAQEAVRRGVHRRGSMPALLRARLNTRHGLIIGMSNEEITDEDYRAYYDAHPDQYGHLSVDRARGGMSLPIVRDRYLQRREAFLAPLRGEIGAELDPLAIAAYRPGEYRGPVVVAIVGGIEVTTEDLEHRWGRGRFSDREFDESARDELVEEAVADAMLAWVAEQEILSESSVRLSLVNALWREENERSPRSEAEKQADVATVIDRNPDLAVYPGWVLLRRILVKPRGSETRETAGARAAEVAGELRASSRAFSRLVHHSDGPFVHRRGRVGSVFHTGRLLRWACQSDGSAELVVLPRMLVDAVLQLDEGGVAVVEDAEGIHILFAERVRAATPVPADELEGVARTTTTWVQPDVGQLGELLTALRASADVQIDRVAIEQHVVVPTPPCCPVNPNDCPHGY
jgi:hypothetical protein